jgi:hypothetical protein
MSQPLEYENISYNAPDGATFGKSASEKISFYGVTPITQYVGVSTASTYIVSTSVISGFNTADAVTSLVSQVSNMVTALRNLGLIA